MTTGAKGAEMPTWDAEVTQGTTGVGYVGMVSSGDTVNLVWSVFDTAAVVRHRRSTNQGSSYAAEQTLNGNGALILEEQVMQSGDTVICLTVYPDQSWNDGYARTGGDISARRSTDGGATFGTAFALTSGFKCLRYALAANGTTWNLFWMDYKNAYWDIYTTRSTDDGVTWNTPTVLISGAGGLGAGLGGPARPEIAMDGDIVHLVWTDPRDNRGECAFDTGATMPNCCEIYYKRSMDKGATWEADQRLTTSASGTYSGRCAIASRDGAVIVNYDSKASGAQNEIGIIRSVASGKAGSWSSPRFLTANSTAINTHGKIKLGLNRDCIVVWNATRGGVESVYGRRSNNAGLTWGPEQKVSAGVAGIPMLVRTSTYWHVGYNNGADTAVITRRGLA